MKKGQETASYQEKYNREHVEGFNKNRRNKFFSSYFACFKILFNY